MLILDDVRYAYDDIDYCFSLKVAAGQCLAIQGPSGAGKSTLLNLIAGFLTPSSGRLGWQRGQTQDAFEDWTGREPWDRPVSTLFQEHNLFDHLSVWENVGLGIHPGLKLSADDKARMTAALEEAGLAGMESRLPGALSGGQRQRVALVRAWLRHSPLLLLDEPFTGLDIHTRETMWAQVRRQCEQGAAVIMISHDKEDVEALADQRLWCYNAMLHLAP
ncbi:ATP-binding cassette domain-containing protein [Pokkaliibacter sp. CJK22405]|uniref:thiamine ABC transporter ATP-binding protein n=1 Tax=Pokkaliibacter sp. CJK22405 TaxID=3384615 RepID=UPI003984D67B